MQLFVIDYWISCYKSLTVFSWEKIAQVDAKAKWVLMVISLWYLSYRMTGKKSFKHGTWMIVMRIRDFPITAIQRNLYLSTNLPVYMLKSYHNFFFSLKLFGFRHGRKLIMPSFLSPLVTYSFIFLLNFACVMRKNLSKMLFLFQVHVQLRVPLVFSEFILSLHCELFRAWSDQLATRCW